MAGDWIAWTRGLPSKLEVIRIATILKIDRYKAACWCMAVWEWADVNTEDGHIPGVTPEDVSLVTGMERIGEAMEAVGWIIREDAGIRLPNWDRYNTKSAKKRLRTRDRVKRHREQQTNRY